MLLKITLFLSLLVPSVNACFDMKKASYSCNLVYPDGYKQNIKVRFTEGEESLQIKSVDLFSLELFLDEKERPFPDLGESFRRTSQCESDNKMIIDVYDTKTALDVNSSGEVVQFHPGYTLMFQKDARSLSIVKNYYSQQPMFQKASFKGTCR